MLAAGPAFAAAPEIRGRPSIEIDAQAEHLVDARVTRRLVTLELSDVEVPPKSFGRAGTRPATLFYRVLGRNDGALRVELWERGEFYGARRVSGSGSAELRARRIALAAFELARGLRKRRISEARLDEERRRLAGEEARRRARLGSGLAYEAAGAGALIGPGDAWLVGPSVGARISGSRPLRLDLGAAWLGGGMPAVPSAHAEWLELRVGSAYSFRRDTALRLSAGLEVAAAIVHAGGAHAVDEIEGQAATWSARAALALRVEPRLAHGTWLTFGPSVGLVLRRMPVEGEKLGGAWLGAVAGIVLDPGVLKAP